MADDRPAGAAPARRRGKPPARPAEPWTRWHLLVAGAAYVVIVAYLIEGRGLSGWLPFLVAALPALLIGKQWKALLMLGAIVAGVGLVVSLLLRSGWLGG
ncbi:MAG TPA: hypothetical protein PK452_13745 [Amaricoccus sp.]|uniref:hypothetical protein n=1 Tax=Amaricoccus sp. TaxID=1872485 RepID=UPI002CA994CC|nr:hypothetical protein [Amaricoccus sp.]HRO12589.1 hypothetical protein [Amaricoccus sp.]